MTKFAFKGEQHDQIREAALSAAFEANERREISYSTETLIQTAVEAAISKTEEINSSFTDDERFAVACALRDWIHEQPFSECGPGADTCPDWPLAFEIRDVVLNALERFHVDN